MSLDADDDTLLLKRVALGDTAAMQTLYKRHHDTAYAFLRSRGADAEQARDLVHDAMLDVWKGAGKFRGASSVRTWILTIARNKFIDRIRASGRLDYVDDVGEMVDETPDAETVITASQDAAQLRSCLGKLKALQRTAIRMAFFDGLTYDEIAEIEGVPVGTIKSRIHHAKQALMHCLCRHKG